MNPVCAKCNKEMVCFKNGVSVAPTHNPRWTRRGDSYRCPTCLATVVTGLNKDGYTDNVDADILVS
jgi:hypothetical protein